MNDQKQQAAARIKQANNILVTVSTNPSVDQLAACIGITIALNKMGKHATAVFSGEVPSILEFLQPEKTLEKNTDSLRDFIIALDKSKADKLRYKVEDKVVKIFITPYKTSISGKDLEFSQGDFNVDVVMALGVHNQADLDQAITAHGRILHDATVITMNNKPGGELGGVNWLDPTASSLSELTAQLLELLDKSVMDEQIATAMLTGIVAETERFSNSKTTPTTMTISATLMTAGANQQLVATKLEEPAPVQPVASATPAAPAGPSEPPKAKKADDGTLEIVHDKSERIPRDEPVEPPVPMFEPEPTPPEQPLVPEAKPLEPFVLPEEPVVPVPEPPKPPQIHIDEHGSLAPLSDGPQLPPREEKLPPAITHHNEPPKMVLEPPLLGGQLMGPASDDEYERPADPLANNSFAPEPMSIVQPTVPITDTPAFGSSVMPPDDTPQPTHPLDVPAPSQPPVIPDLPPLPPAPEPATPSVPDDKTLTEIEQDVHSSHLQPPVEPPAPSLPLPEPVTTTSATPAPGLNPFAAPAPVFSAPAPVSSMPAEPVIPEPVIPAVQPPAAPAADALPPAATADLQSARDAVLQALNTPDAEQPAAPAASPQPAAVTAPLNPEPVQQPAVPDFGMPNPAAALAPAPAWDPATAPFQPPFASTPVAQPAPNPAAPGTLPSTPAPAMPPFDPLNPGGAPQATDPNAPPPVPPPMMPPSQF